MEVSAIAAKLPFKSNGYEFISLIGSGTFGSVVKATNIQRGHYFAAKFIRFDAKVSELVDSISSEFDCLMNLFHPFVIKIYDRFFVDDYLVFILELCNDSVDHLIKSGQKLSEKQLIVMMKQLLIAIQYCHKNGVAHRDIKPENILISETGTVKLGDFGLGITMKEKEKVSKYNGTFIFKAPELLKKIEHCPFKADIWSLGVTFYFIATGTYPWGKTLREIEENILQGFYSFPADVPQSVIRIIKKMLVINPYKRATADELLEDQVFAEVKTISPIYERKMNTCDCIPLTIKTSAVSYKTKRKFTTLSRSGASIARVPSNLIIRPSIR